MNQKQKKIGKRPLIGLLIVLGTITSCAGLPSPPTGSLYMHYAKKQIALCSDLTSGNPCPPIPITDTDKFIMLEPKTWKELQDYVDALLRLAKRNQTGFFSRKTKEDQELIDVLYRIKFLMKRSDEIFNSRKGSV